MADVGTMDGLNTNFYAHPPDQSMNSNLYMAPSVLPLPLLQKHII